MGNKVNDSKRIHSFCIWNSSQRFYVALLHFCIPLFYWWLLWYRIPWRLRITEKMINRNDITHLQCSLRSWKTITTKCGLSTTIPSPFFKIFQVSTSFLHAIFPMLVSKTWFSKIVEVWHFVLQIKTSDEKGNEKAKQKPWSFTHKKMLS